MEQSPFPDNLAIDPSFSYTLPHAHPSTNSSDAGTSSTAQEVSQSEHTSPASKVDHPLPASTRASSPSTEVVKSRHSPYAHHHPRLPDPEHGQRPPRVQRPSSSFRQRPYTHKARRPGPTSAPSSVVLMDADESPVMQDAEKYIFTAYQDQTTLVMGILLHLDALTRQCEEMRNFVKTGFSDGNDYPSEMRTRAERCVTYLPFDLATTWVGCDSAP